MVKSMFPLLGTHVILKQINVSVCAWVLSCIGLFMTPWTFLSSLGSFVHGIFQARVLEWVAIPSPGDLPQLGIKPISPALAGEFFIPSHQGKHRLPYSFVNFLTAENLTIFACHCILGVKYWALHRVNIQKIFMKDWIYVIIILILQISIETQESKCLCS